MARRTQEIRPFTVGGIERGLARGEAREIRKQEQARQERLDEEARLAREQATRVQGAQLAQGQQRIDIAREQAGAQAQFRTQQQLFQQQEAAEQQEFRESQARVSNNLAVLNALPKGIPPAQKLGLLQSVFEDLDMDNNPLAGIDLTQIDVDDATKDINDVWGAFNKGDLTKPQLEVAMQQVFAKHADSAAAKGAATAASAIARGGEATARTTIAAGTDAQQKADVLMIRQIDNQLNEQLADETFAVTGTRRAELIRRRNRLQDEQFFARFPEERPTPAQAQPAPPTVEPAPTQVTPTAPAPEQAEEARPITISKEEFVSRSEELNKEAIEAGEVKKEDIGLLYDAIQNPQTPTEEQFVARFKLDDQFQSIAISRWKEPFNEGKIPVKIDEELAKRIYNDIQRLGQ